MTPRRTLLALSLLFASCAASAQDPVLLRAVNERLAGDNAAALSTLNAYLAAHPEDDHARLEKLRLLVLTDPDKNRRQAQEIAGSLCRRSDTRLCLEAEAVAEMTDALNLYKLSPILAAEARGDAATARRFYDAAWGDAPGEDGLRIRWAVNLLQFPGREKEGLALLAPLAKRTDDAFIALRARGEIRRHQLASAVRRGMQDIQSDKTRESGIRHLSRALALAPDDPRAEGWRHEITSALKILEARRAAAEKRRAQAAAVRTAAITPAAPRPRPASEMDVLKTWAQKCREEKDEALLIFVLGEMLDRTGPTPAVTDELARLYVKAGAPEKAVALFGPLSEATLLSRDWIYPYARTLADAGDGAKALEALAKSGITSPRLTALKEKLTARDIVRTAKARASRGEWQQALKEISAAGLADPAALTLRAQWSQKLANQKAALEDYERLFNEPDYAQDAKLAATEIHLNLGEKNDALRLLEELTQPDAGELTLANLRRAALLYRKLGRPSDAGRLYDEASRLALVYEPEAAQLARDRADFLESEGRPDEALAAYRRGFVAAGLALTEPRSDRDFTRAMLTPDAESDWVREAMRLHASLLYQNHNVIVTTGVRRLHDEGTHGYSDTRGTITMAEALMPAAGGTLMLRNDVVHYNMGRIQPGAWEAMTGTCFSGGCDPAKGHTKDTGDSIAVGWTNGTVAFDVGTTPVGFHYVDVVGAASVNFSAGPLSLTTEIYRRAKDGSLLAYGGQRDPATGLWWGGVRKTGASISASLDKGGAFGFWGKAAWEAVTGRNVARNSDWQLMASNYARLVNRQNHELSVSLFTMLYGYEKDLSGYTFGQGGYYSPQTSLSFTASITDTGRTENWAWRATASASRSYAKTEGRPRYFHIDRIPAWQRAEMSDLDSVSDTDSDWSKGWSVTGALERRVSAHFSAGIAAGMSKAPDYDYRWGLFYLRWYQKPWLGNLPMPVPLLTPYSSR